MELRRTNTSVIQPTTALLIWACNPEPDVATDLRTTGDSRSETITHYTRRARDFDPNRPFECGEIDVFDLEAIEAGGALEGSCSNDPPGTWLAVAAKIRTESECGEVCVVSDPEALCLFAACANAYFEAGTRSTCEDVSTFVEAMFDTVACRHASRHRPDLTQY
jgi:hypothetical protein